MKTLPMIWSAWSEEVVRVMLLILLKTLSCSSVLTDQPLINHCWIGA